MTEPKMIRCPGSGQKVDGPDEPDNTVQCRVCGTSFLRMKTAATAEGKKEFSVSEHKRRANPPRRKGVRTAPPRGRGGSGRGIGRRY
jgi:hypothetical protein